MKKITIYILLLFCIVRLEAQQKPLTTLFMTNPFAINPALAGTYGFFQIISNNRFQWVGFEDAPITNTLSFFGPLKNHPMGYGGTITYDVTGPVSMGSFYGSYAYYYTIDESKKISMGLNLGMMQYRVDMSKIELAESDPIYANGTRNIITPDASLGVYFWEGAYSVGIIATHLLNNKLNFGDNPTGLSKLKSHFYLTAGYKHFFNREWAVEPTLILKKVSPAPYQLDFNARGFYKNMVWFGVSYRTQEALSILVGYIYEKKIQIGYSYDIVLNPLGAHNFGSHELVLSYKFDRIKD